MPPTPTLHLQHFLSPYPYSPRLSSNHLSVLIWDVLSRKHLLLASSLPRTLYITLASTWFTLSYNCLFPCLYLSLMYNVLRQWMGHVCLVAISSTKLRVCHMINMTMNMDVSDWIQMMPSSSPALNPGPAKPSASRVRHLRRNQTNRTGSLGKVFLLSFKKWE